jgi:hypothetical protein
LFRVHFRESSVPKGLRPGDAVPAEGPSCVPTISFERRRAFRQNRAAAPVAQLIAVLLKLAVFTGRHSHNPFEGLHKRRQGFITGRGRDAFQVLIG